MKKIKFSKNSNVLLGLKNRRCNIADMNTILREIVVVKRAIAIVEQITGYEKYGDMGKVKIKNEVEDVFLRDEFDSIINGLADMKSRIEYLMLPSGVVPVWNMMAMIATL